MLPYESMLKCYEMITNYTSEAETMSHPWFAISTKSNCEKVVADSLVRRDLESFLPSFKTKTVRAGRVVERDKPLFPGYLFCRFNVSARLPILMTPGVARIVSIGSEPVPVDPGEIEALRAIVDSGVAVEPHQYLEEGQRIVITKGPLKEMHGILLRKKSECRFIASVSLLRRSVSVEVDSSWLSPEVC
jgi:transcriptional antiterminator NusG